MTPVSGFQINADDLNIWVNLPALSEGDRVEIRGLCSFFIKEYKSYQGRNPMTGEPVRVAAKKLPFFKIGKELKERVDY